MRADPVLEGRGSDHDGTAVVARTLAVAGVDLRRSPPVVFVCPRKVAGVGHRFRYRWGRRRGRRGRLEGAEIDAARLGTWVAGEVDVFDAVFSGVGGGSAADDIRLGSDDAEVRGGAGNDLIIGGDGADELYGGAGNDRVFGGAGNDAISGSTNDGTNEFGSDELRGGAGNDQFFSTTEAR